MIDKRVKKNVPIIWKEYPYATIAVCVAGLVIGFIAGAWVF